MTNKVKKTAGKIILCVLLVSGVSIFAVVRLFGFSERGIFKNFSFRKKMLGLSNAVGLDSNSFIANADSCNDCGGGCDCGSGCDSSGAY